MNITRVPINKTCHCGQHFHEVPGQHDFMTADGVVLGVIWNCPQCKTTLCLSSADLITAIKKLGAYLSQEAA